MDDDAATILTQKSFPRWFLERAHDGNRMAILADDYPLSLHNALNKAGEVSLCFLFVDHAAHA